MKFVSKDLAIKLKEKGFDRPCFGFYNEYNEYDNELYYTENFNIKSYKDLLMEYNYSQIYVSASTTDQVLEWLRDEKNVHIGIMPYFTKSTKNNIMWQWEILLIGKIIECKNTLYIDKDYNYTKMASENCYAGYDDACVYAIEFVINNLI